MTKAQAFIRRATEQHWVGDGFPVRTMFSYDDRPEALSPFLLLDYAGPMTFEPTAKRRGVGPHPHRGFETVTIAYHGEVEHRDSAGGGGVIREGDVQWMTAGAGLVHQEFHTKEFAARGGPFEVIQLWVNLPKAHKMTPPRYQAITAADIPTVALPDDAGTVRIIAGEHAGTPGPAHTFSPVNLWAFSLKPQHPVHVRVPAGHTTMLFVLDGGIRLTGGEAVGTAELAVLERDGDEVAFETLEPTRLLLLSGEPFTDPVVGYGPFVMTNEAEIRQAVIDYESGRMGQIHATHRT